MSSWCGLAYGNALEVPAGGKMGEVDIQGLPEITPEEASRNGVPVRDQDLAMLAAV